MFDLLPYTTVYFLWIPLVFWVLFFIVCKFLTYPAVIKKRLKKGEPWVYIPEWWKKNAAKVLLSRLVQVVLAVLAVASSTFALTFALWYLQIEHFEYGAASAIAFLILLIVLSKYASKQMYELERATFYLYMQRLRVASQKKGLATTMDNLRSRSTWELQRTLSRVEKRGCLRRYLLAAATTKKFPKELYQETVR